ncbi:hypothetical protein D3C76_1621810 [compost metagenome]
MPIEAVQGEIHLPQRRFAKQFMLSLGQQGTIRCNVHLESLLMCGIEQQIYFGMQQGFAFDM